MASPLHSSSPTLSLHGDCGFHPIAPQTSFLPRSPLHQNPRCPCSRCCPCPLWHLRLFPSFFRVVVCILMTLNPPCFSAFSTGASCSFGELSLLAAFSLPLLMGAPLFLDLASAGNQFTALALLFFCLQNCYFPRPQAGCWTSRIEYPLLSHFACLQLN